MSTQAMDASLFLIQPAAAEPIYRQMVEQTRRMIASGQLTPGEAMPSVRDVAAHHAINPMTVSKAYSLLEMEGLLERQRGKGMVVAAQQANVKSQTDRLHLLDPAIQALANQANELELPANTVINRLKEFLENK
jgi:GntR family transcriptional regulator